MIAYVFIGIKLAGIMIIWRTMTSMMIICPAGNYNLGSCGFIILIIAMIICFADVQWLSII